jgi:hypothetical protein
MMPEDRCKRCDQIFCRCQCSKQAPTKEARTEQLLEEILEELRVIKASIHDLTNMRGTLRTRR